MQFVSDTYDDETYEHVYRERFYCYALYKNYVKEAE